jgi:hypothetical protein
MLVVKNLKCFKCKNSTKIGVSEPNLLAEAAAAKKKIIFEN